MTPPFRTNTKPMDFTSGLQPMSADDEAFWQSRRANDNPRPTFTDVRRDYAGLLALAFGVAVIVAGWALHGAFPK